MNAQTMSPLQVVSIAVVLAVIFLIFVIPCFAHRFVKSRATAELVSDCSADPAKIEVTDDLDKAEKGICSASQTEGSMPTPMIRMLLI